MRFQNVSIKDENGDLISEVFSGKTLNVDLEIFINRAIINPQFRIMFVDTKGVVRFLCNNQFSMVQTLNLNPSGKQIIRCKIPNFPLPKGIYSIQLTCNSTNGVEDDVEAAMELEVAGGDFFNTGKEQFLKEGVLVKNSFEVIQ